MNDSSKRNNPGSGSKGGNSSNSLHTVLALRAAVTAWQGRGLPGS
jgi:hypothetical protein